MRRLLVLVVGVLAFTRLGAAPTSVAAPPAGPAAEHDRLELLQVAESTVFVTRTGNRYHRGGCQYLRRSSIAVTLSAAKASGYTPCHVCMPPE